jgi:hypothetical protein
VTAAFLVAGCLQGPAAQPPAGGRVTGPGADRGGLHRLSLSVPRTEDLNHADPAHFATALGNDPQRIFAFVRDHIAFEAYRGLLRGPRGTLLGAAGNSVDRAALLAAMMEQAGQHVRFARGTLDERHARDLVVSMWARHEESPAGPVPNAPPDIKAIVDILPTAVGRDLGLIRERLAALGVQVRQDTVPEAAALVAEAQQHYWVQWLKDGQWIDLDPLFADARPGQAYARGEESFPTLPDSLAHQVRIRVKVEEYADATASSRVVLTYSAKAAELSAADVILMHVPENWQGPATGLQEGIGQAVSNTGRLRPVLLTRTQYFTGDPFLPPGSRGGIGSIPLLLGGARDAPTATAEFLEVEFAAPSGPVETVTREVYDAIGPARRAAAQMPTRDDLQRLQSADLTKGAYSLYFTTGRIDAGHVTATSGPPAPASGDGVDMRVLLNRLHVAFAVASDSMTGRTAQADRADVVFYPDSPRMTILDLTVHGDAPRLRLDLRRTRARAVATGAHPDDAVLARIWRGVVEGTLERVLVDLWTHPVSGGVRAGDVFGTSVVFDAAQSIPTLALPAQRNQIGGDVSPDALARLDADLAAGFVAVAPQRAPSINGTARYAWWRIHPGSGETTAVTDEGLYLAGVEDAGVRAVSRTNAVGARVLVLQIGSAMTGWTTTFVFTAQRIAELGGLPAVLQLLRTQGIPFIGRP